MSKFDEFWSELENNTNLGPKFKNIRLEEELKEKTDKLQTVKSDFAENIKRYIEDCNVGCKVEFGRTWIVLDLDDFIEYLNKLEEEK